MSLQTDIIFVKALNANEALAQALGGRIYNTAIPLPDEDIDNVPLPYCIVSFVGMTNDDTTKDDSYEGDFDNVHIAVEVAAKTRQQLAELVVAIRDTVHGYFTAYDGEEDKNLVPLGYQVSAQSVTYDQYKPCFWQVLDYQCDTYTDLESEEDEEEG